MENKIHTIKIHIMNDILTDLTTKITYDDILKLADGDDDLASYVEMELMESRFIKVEHGRRFGDKTYISRLKFFVFERDGLI